MKRKLSIIVLSLSLAVIIMIATIGITFANGNKDKKKDGSNVVAYGQHGEVILQLPTPSNKPAPPAALGTPWHPTCLRLIAGDIEKKSTFGASDNLDVYLWMPAMNSFVPVAHITDQDDPDALEFFHAVYIGLPIWNTAVEEPNMRNVITVEDNELDVWKEGDVIMANLTKAVTITLDFTKIAALAAWGDQTFVLPPMTLMFRPIARDFANEESVTLIPSPPYSGWTMTVKSRMSPAWVKAQIPLWVKGGWIECSGHICTHLVQTGIPPGA
jgi:hypothetical protein